MWMVFGDCGCVEIASIKEHRNGLKDASSFKRSERINVH